MARILAFAQYKGKANLLASYSNVSPGSPITAASFNLAVYNLEKLSSHISYPIPTTVTTADKIYASYYQDLKAALNSIT
jgi:hypothetical protein